MILTVAATFLPDADEVNCECFTTEDDAETLTVPDKVLLVLLQQVESLIGTKTYVELSRVEILSMYARPDKTFHSTFRHPQRRMDLFIDMQATFGSTVYNQRTQVGLAKDPHVDMVLPDNALWTRDALAEINTQGPDTRMPSNHVVLAPEIRSYVKTFDFNVTIPEAFSDLTYSGGGHRLLMNSQTNQFEYQELNQAPWDIPAYMFMEPASENSLPNAFFLQADQNPTGWVREVPLGALVQADVDWDHSVSSYAKIWTIRARQQTVSQNRHNVRFFHEEKFWVAANLYYTFSVYLKLTPKARDTDISQFGVKILWYDINDDLITEATHLLNLVDYQSLSLASVTSQAPSSAYSASVEIFAGSLDSGDDIEIQIMTPQMETGRYATSRMDGISRLEDRIQIPQYNAANQKVRVEFIAGIDSALIQEPLLMIEGPVALTFEPGNLVKAELVGYGSVEGSISFSAGDRVDITVSHVSEGSLAIYRDGDLINEVALGVVTPTTDPLDFIGIGVELMRLSVFSRI